MPFPGHNAQVPAPGAFLTLVAHPSITTSSLLPFSQGVAQSLSHQDVFVITSRPNRGKCLLIPKPKVFVVSLMPLRTYCLFTGCSHSLSLQGGSQVHLKPCLRLDGCLLPPAPTKMGHLSLTPPITVTAIAFYQIRLSS